MIVSIIAALAVQSKSSEVDEFSLHPVCQIDRDAPSFPQGRKRPDLQSRVDDQAIQFNVEHRSMQAATAVDASDIDSPSAGDSIQTVSVEPSSGPTQVVVTNYYDSSKFRYSICSVK